MGEPHGQQCTQVLEGAWIHMYTILCITNTTQAVNVDKVCAVPP